MNVLVPVKGTRQRTGVADDAVEVCAPERLDLYEVLRHWLDFRYTTVRRRFEYDLAKLRERIHILEGFAILFADIDEAIRLIRASDGKKDAAKKLMEAFPLDEVQTNAILELRLYKLARLEIAIILDELEEKRAAAAEIERILGSEALLWSRVRSELLEIRNLYATPRRTLVGAPEEKLEFDDSAYIVREETFAVITRGGWIKRQNSFSDIGKIRIRENDEIGWLLHTDTASTISFFVSDGCAYTLRVGDIGATTGYGTPLQRHFQLPDGAKIVGVVPDKRYWQDLVAAESPPEDEPPPPYMVSVTVGGRVQRFALATHTEPSNRNGRMYARLGKGDEVLAAHLAGGGEHACMATKDGNALTFPVSEANLLKAAGKGTTAIKLKAEDAVIAYELSSEPRSGPIVHTSNGREVIVTPKKFGGSRAARGKSVIRRGGLGDWKREAFVFTGQPEAEE